MLPGEKGANVPVDGVCARCVSTVAIMTYPLSGAKMLPVPHAG